MSHYHETYMQQAIELAWQARRAGDHPFGALLFREDTVILTAVNTVNSTGDVTRHAELNLVSQASRQFSAETLAQVTLYTSTEPCAMCAGAIFWAGIRRVVFGCTAQTLAEISGGSSLLMPCREIFVRGEPATAVTGPVLAVAARKVHEGFW